MAGCRGSQRTAAAVFRMRFQSGLPPGPTSASGNPTAIEFSGRTAPSASGRCGMGLPNAPTAYTDVCRRWRVPVRHSGRFSGVAAAASTAVVVGAAWAIGHMRTTGRPWRAERACRRPPIWTGPPKSVGICSARTRQSRQDPRASYRSTGTCSRPSSTAWSPRRSPNH